MSPQNAYSTGLPTRRIRLAHVSIALIALVLAATALIEAPRASAFHSGTAETIYVSPLGEDDAPGTRSNPLRTLEGARDAVRRLLRTTNGNIRVRLLGGTYRLNRELLLDHRDSGRGGHQVFWEAEPGQRPRISGSIPVTNFKLFDPARGIFRAKVPVGSRSRQLYVNGRRAIRSRSGDLPKGFTRTDAGYEAPSGALSSWRRPTDLEFISQPRSKMLRCPVAAVDGRNVTMAQPCWNNANLGPGDTNFRLVSRIENALELVDSPGEWYLDSQEGALYYLPRTGESMGSARVELPVLETLINGRGTASLPIQNIRFEGIKFENATWLAPNSSDGYASDQSGYRVVGDGHPTNKTGHDPNLERTAGNVRFRYARGIEFVRNSFVRLGGTALDLGTGTQFNRVIGNRFQDISSAAIQLGGVDIVDHHPMRPVEATRDNEIANNLIKSIGRDYKDASAITAGFVSRTRIAHNDISFVPWSGISLGWGWGLLDQNGFMGLPGAEPGEWGVFSKPTTTADNQIVNNRISKYLLALWDGGGIYTLGQQGPSLEQGALISGNVIASKRPRAGGNSIFTDGGSRYVRIEQNVLVDNQPGVTDFGPCGRGDSLESCGVEKSYGSDRGGCRPYGDIAYADNFWQHPAMSFEGCSHPPHPVNVTDRGNSEITGASVASRSIVDRAGLQRDFRKRVGAG